jgi:RNA polymerase sigma-70 factor (ECF subfamily)
MEEGFSGLILRARSGDREAVGELYSAHRRRLLAVVRRRMGPALRRDCDAEDLVHTVFAQVLRDLPRFEDRGEGAFRRWLDLKAENEVRTRFRQRLLADGGRREVTMAESAAERAAGTGRGPATSAAERDERRRLADLLDGLRPEQREVLFLRERDGLAFADVAERLGLPNADAARMRYARALLALRDRWVAG